MVAWAVVFSSPPMTRGPGSAKRLLREPVAALRHSHNDRRGDGATVVLLHGWPGTRDCWQRVTRLVAGSVAVVLSDLHGLDESCKPERSRRLYPVAAHETSADLSTRCCPDER